MNLFTHIKSLLSKNEKFCKDNELFKNNVVEAALKLDTELIKLLLTDNKAKETFFNDIEGVMIFDKVKFQKFVSNKQFLPDSYTAFKNKIGLTANGEFLTDAKEVVLDFPYKDCVLEGGQTKEDQKRKEIFWNETLAPDDIDRLFEPKAFTNWKKYDKDGEHEVTDISLEDNLIIKGNNLIALHSLKEVYRGKIKLIYIDPPFNTKNDGFKYNDSFNHATWLTFMKNRLEVARELLTHDGVFFVQCDNNEFSYLSILLDEIFGRQNFVNVISVKSSTPSGVKTSHANKKILKSQDFIFVYKKSELLLNPQYTKKEKWDTHYMFYVRENKLLKLVDVLKQEKLLENNQNIKHFDVNNKNHKEFYIKHGDNIVRKSTHDNKEIKNICANEYMNKIYSHKGNLYLNNDMLQPISKSIQIVLDGQKLTKDISNLLCDFWGDIDFQNTQNQGGVSFPAGKKPEQLLYRIIDMTTKPNDIILDYHLGSGTTAAVAHKMSRRYIGIEQMDYIENVAVERLKNVIEGEQGGISESLEWKGGKSFIYTEIATSKSEYISSINNSKESNQLLKIWDKLKKDECISHKVSPTKIDKEVKNFKDLDLEKQKHFLLSIIDSNQLYVNYSDMKDKNHTITDTDKDITTKFYYL